MLGLGNTILSDYKPVFLNNYSLQFHGSDDYLNCDEIVDLISTAEGSISLWTKIDTTTSTGNIFRMQSDSDNFISIFYHAGSNETRTTYKGGGSAVTAVSRAAIEGDGNWHHIVSTWNTTANELKLYLDGSLIQTKPNTGSLPTFGDEPTTADIAQNTAGSSYFKGFVDEVGIFDETLTLAEITEIYNGGEPNDIGLTSARPKLQVYHRFEIGSGTETKDNFGETLGILVNTPTWSTDTP